MLFLFKSKKHIRAASTEKERVIRIYRGILKQARMFFDENARDFINTFAKKKFRQNMHDLKPGRPQKKLQNAQTALHLLEKANSHKFKSVLSVLEYAYGRKGPRKTEMLKAVAGICKREQIFGNLNRVSHYRPAFYAMAKNHFGEKKMQVNKEALKSRHPLNIAKMQDRHWEEIRRRVAVPVSPKVMNMLEKRAEDGIIKITREMSELDSVQAQLVNQWVGRWVKMPPKRQIIRYYRSLLEQITEMKVEKILVPNQVNFYRSMARKNTRTESGREEPDLVPKRSFMFRKSPLSGKRPLPPVSCIDIANI